MKTIKKILNKISGALQYLKYLGKLSQMVKVIAAILPQIVLLVPEKDKKLIQDLSGTLNKVAAGLDKTEAYLNDMGIQTALPEVKGSGRKRVNGPTLRDNVKLLGNLAEDIA